MDEKRKNLYYLKTTGDAKALERGIAKIEGVTFARVDSAKKTLEYEIDEKASDYDVFTEVMQKVADAGADIDFERDDTKGGEAPDDSSAGPEEKLPPETEEAAPEKEKRKPWDENLVRVFELGFAIICFVAAMFIHHRIAKLIVLALSFSVAGYDALYEAWVKMTKKVIFSYELVISLAAFACILTGRVEYTVAAMVLYSVVNFVRKYIVMRMDKNSVYWENPEKVHITSESGTFEKDYALVVPGETAVFYKGDRIVFDGTLKSGEAEVTGLDGKARTLKAGDEVLAGEISESQIEVSVTRSGETCKCHLYNEYVKKSAFDENGFSDFAKRKEQLYNIVVLAVSLLIAFLMPLFDKFSYVDGLYRWGNRAAMVAAVSGLGYYVFACRANIDSALKAGRKCGAFLGGHKSAKRIASAKSIYIDEDMFYDGEGNLKADSHGAVWEITDAGLKDLTLATIKSDEDALETCKALNIPSYCKRNNKEEKLKAVYAANCEGADIAVSAKDFKAEEDEKPGAKKKQKNGGVICFDCLKGGFKGDGAVMHDRIAYLPYIIKIAKRTAAFDRAALIAGLLVKITLCVLALSGLIELWLAVLCDSAVSIGLFLLAFFNGNEIY